MAEYLISQGRIGCVPGADFGANGEGYVRFCFARDRKELDGALTSLGALFVIDRSDSRLLPPGREVWVTLAARGVVIVPV